MKDQQGEEPLVIIDPAVLFSKSAIWQLNKQYYQQQGIKAWSEGPVPHHISSNARVGKVYAELIFAAMKDDIGNESEEPMHIIELGAGHGRLAFHVLRELDHLLAASKENLPGYKYVLTDVSVATLEFLSEHPQLHVYYERGVLDLGLVDSDTSDDIQLMKSKVTLCKGGLHRSLVVVANYFFDSVASDVIYFNDHSATACLLQLCADKIYEDDDVEALIDNLQLQFSIDDREIGATGNTSDLISSLVEHYKQNITESFVPIPTASIDTINRIRALTTAPVTVIAMDKGINSTGALDHTPPPDMVTHGSLSFAVNFDALLRHCQMTGGSSMAAQSPFLHLQVVCMRYDESKIGTEMAIAYSRFVEDFQPEDLDHVKSFVFEHFATADMSEILGVIKLFAYDQEIFHRVMPRIKQLIGSVTHHERSMVSYALSKIATTYFHIGQGKDLYFEIAGLYYQLGLYEEALIYFHLSEERYGTSGDGYYNRLLCYYQLRRDKEFSLILIEGRLEYPGFAPLETMTELDLGAV